MRWLFVGVAAVLAVSVISARISFAQSAPDAGSQCASDSAEFDPAIEQSTTDADPCALPADGEPSGAAEPVVFAARGTAVTEPFTVPSAISIATITHTGRGIFVVKVVQPGRESVLVSMIGAYQGARPILMGPSVALEIRADGDWSVTIAPIGAGTPPFSGRGDTVSGLFEPLDAGVWDISHDGRSNFVARLICGGGTALVQNAIGRVQASVEVRPRGAPCLWEVRADGAWSLRPR